MDRLEQQLSLKKKVKEIYGVHPRDTLSMTGFCLLSYGVQLCVEGMALLSGLWGHSNYPKSFKVRLGREPRPQPQWSPGA